MVFLYQSECYTLSAKRFKGQPFNTEEILTLFL